MRPFFVYMLRCNDGSYYVGHTDDLDRRIAEHGDGAFGGYTAERRPVTLVWCTELDTRDEALERELQLKRWSRTKKEALIASDWPRLKELARGPDRPRPSTSPGLAAGLRSGRTDRTGRTERVRQTTSRRTDGTAPNGEDGTDHV